MMEVMRVALCRAFQIGIACARVPGRSLDELASRRIDIAERLPEFRPRRSRDNFFVKRNRLIVFLLRGAQFPKMFQGAEVIRPLGEGSPEILLGRVPLPEVEGELAQLNQTPCDDLGRRRRQIPRGFERPLKMQPRRIVRATRELEPGETRFDFNRIAFPFLHLVVSSRGLIEIAEFKQRVTE